MSLLDRITLLRMAAIYFYWATKTMWLSLSGRLFYFRDAPTWVVEELAETTMEDLDLTDEHDKGVSLYIQEARNELQRRRFRAAMANITKPTKPE